MNRLHAESEVAETRVAEPRGARPPSASDRRRGAHHGLGRGAPSRRRSPRRSPWLVLSDTYAGLVVFVALPALAFVRRAAAAHPLGMWLQQPQAAQRATRMPQARLARAGLPARGAVLARDTWSSARSTAVNRRSSPRLAGYGSRTGWNRAQLLRCRCATRRRTRSSWREVRAARTRALPALNPDRRRPTGSWRRVSPHAITAHASRWTALAVLPGAEMAPGAPRPDLPALSPAGHCRRRYDQSVPAEHADDERNDRNRDRAVQLAVGARSSCGLDLIGIAARIRRPRPEHARPIAGQLHRPRTSWNSTHTQRRASHREAAPIRSSAPAPASADRSGIDCHNLSAIPSRERAREGYGSSGSPWRRGDPALHGARAWPPVWRTDRRGGRPRDRPARGRSISREVRAVDERRSRRGPWPASRMRAAAASSLRGRSVARGSYPNNIG